MYIRETHCSQEISVMSSSKGASLVAQLVKNPPAMWETWVKSLGWEDPLGEEKGYPLQYSGLENPMDYIVHGVTESDTTERLSLSLPALRTAFGSLAQLPISFMI